MSEITPESRPEPPGAYESTVNPPVAADPGRGSTDSGSQVAIAAIIAIAVVALCCIVSCAVVAYTFFINAPW